MSLVTTKNGKMVLKNAESIMFVPYVYDNTISDYIVGQDVYDISAIVGDSIVVEQSEGDKSRKSNEFVSSPILEAYSNGEYAFAAQCLDFQNSVMKSVFSAMTGSGIEGLSAMMDDFALCYALVRIRFTDADISDVYLPKVQLGSRVFIQQLKTRTGQGNIGGVSLSRQVSVINGTDQNLAQFDVVSPAGHTYAPFTPMLLVPKAYAPVVVHHKTGNDQFLCSRVDFSTGSVTHDVLADIKQGTWSVYSQNSGTDQGSQTEGGVTDEE